MKKLSSEKEKRVCSEEKKFNSEVKEHTPIQCTFLTI
jgi:hypothetical protein